MQAVTRSSKRRKPTKAPPTRLSLHFKHSKLSHPTSPTVSLPHPIHVGSYRLTPGVDLLPFTDSTPLYLSGNFPSLFTRLHTDGVIFVRNVISSATISAARQLVLSHLRSKGALDPSSDPSSAPIHRPPGGERVRGWTVDADSGGVNGNREDDAAVAGWKAVGTSDSVRAVYDGPELHRFFQAIFAAGHRMQGGGGVVPPTPFTTFPDCTWLRIRGHGDDTTEHTDYYYFKQERTIFQDHFLHADPPPPPPPTCTVCQSPADPHLTLLCDLCDHPMHTYCHTPPLPRPPAGEYHCPTCANLPFPFYTAWLALGPVHTHHGRLAVVEGTHRLQGYEAHPKSDGKLPREWGGGKGRVWRSSDMEGGDVLLFNMKTVHAASVNQSEQFRLSIDTRVTMAQGREWERRKEREGEGSAKGRM